MAVAVGLAELSGSGDSVSSIDSVSIGSIVSDSIGSIVCEGSADADSVCSGMV